MENIIKHSEKGYKREQPEQIGGFMKYMQKFLNSDHAAALLPILIIAVVSFAVYSNTLVNDFVYDDGAQVGKNPWIRDIRYIPDMFTSSVWSFQSGPVTSNYYRPMMNVIFLINYHIFGLKPWGFHLTNILFHVGVSVLVYFVASQLLGEYVVRQKEGVAAPSLRNLLLSPPFIAAFLFAAHPIHTEAVAWVSALPELSFSLFCLLSLYFYMRGGAGFSRDYFFSAALFLVAVFCKEQALTLPVLFVIYDLTFRRPPASPLSEGRMKWGYHLKRYIPYIAISAGYLALRIYALGGFAPAMRFAHLSAFQFFINIFPLFAQYIEKLFLPINLNAFYVFHPVTSVFDMRFFSGIMVMAVFTVSAFISFRKSRTVFFCLLMLAVPLLPVLYIPGLGENTFTERYAYFPSVGFSILLALSLDQTLIVKAGRALLAALVVISLTGVYSIQTIKRNTVWKDQFALFTDTVEKSPDSAIPHSSLALALYQRGRVEEAIAHYQEAIRLNPSDEGSYNNLGVIYLDKGWTERAVQMLQAAIKIDPGNAEARTNLGLAFVKIGLRDKAIEQYETVVRFRPNFAEAHNNLGIAYAESGWIDRAFEQFRIALTLNPEYADAHSNMGAAYAKTGQVDKAIEEFASANVLNPANANFHHSLGLVLLEKGLTAKAVTEFETATRLQPDNAEFFNNLGAAYAELGLMDQAVEHFKTAVRLSPDHPDYRWNLEKAMEMKTPAAGKEK